MSWQFRWLRLLSPAPLAACFVGCQWLSGAHTLPDDPLFLTHKPLDTKAQQTVVVPIAHAEPAPPQNPYFAADQVAVRPGHPEGQSSGLEPIKRPRDAR